MSDQVRRGEIATQIERLIALAGVTHVTITLTAENARELSKDLAWACKTTIRQYQAEKIDGTVLE